MQVIIFANEKNGVSVCVPTGELPIEQVQAKDTPAGSIIVNSELLPDNDFFEAWELNGALVSVNKAKAIELTKMRLRIERIELLKEQDVLFQRALESNSDTIAIVAEKQRLRDVTKLADNANTLDELKTLTAKVIL